MLKVRTVAATIAAIVPIVALANIFTKVFIIILFVTICGCSFGCQEVSYGPGVLAPNPPVQNNIKNAEQIVYEEYLIKPLAEFSIKAKVLSVKRYSSDLSPVDLALGWGHMSDETVIDKISISQSNRWYYWRVTEYPIPRRDIEINSANMHMIPASPEVAKQIGQVKKGDMVEFYGYLVEVKRADGWYWKSSLTREDTGNHSCELVWVEYFKILSPSEPPWQMFQGNRHVERII
ncbi:hypothetical protein ACFLV8_00740 [Chloroflexota bacterium]